jgi:TPR repeat protein
VKAKEWWSKAMNYATITVVTTNGEPDDMKRSGSSSSISSNSSASYSRTSVTTSGYQFGTLLQRHCESVFQHYLTVSIAPAASKPTTSSPSTNMPNMNKILYIVGRCYLTGFGVELDEGKAVAYWCKGVNDSAFSSIQVTQQPLSPNEGWCEYAVAYLHEMGRGITKDAKKAVELYCKSMACGNTQAAANLAGIFLNDLCHDPLDYTVINSYVSEICDRHIPNR